MKHVSLLLLIGITGFTWLNFTLFEWPESNVDYQTLHGPLAHETEAAMKRFLQEALSEGNIELVDDMVADDYVARSFENGILYMDGRDALKDAIIHTHSHYPEYEITMTDYSVYDDRVVFYWPGGRVLESGLPVMDPHAQPGIYGIAIFCFEDGILYQTYYNRFFDYQSGVDGPAVNEDIGGSDIYEKTPWIHRI